MRKIIIDTDPGIDDAAALALAVFSKELDVQLITTVAGNVGLDKTTYNALRMVSLWDARIPVAAGAARPLSGPVYDAAEAHGESGMDGFTFDAVTARTVPMHAVEAMRRVLMRSEEKITLVPIGPLTNIALLFSTYPEVKEKSDEIVLMGGAFLRGNITPMAEFNIFADPEAADIVFKSGLPLVMCGLELAQMATITGAMVGALREKNPTARMVCDLFEHYRGGDLENGMRMYDSTAICYLLAPELYTTKDCFIGIETASPLTRGMTVCDLEGFWGREPNGKVCTAVDPEGFRRLFLEGLENASGAPENPTAAMWLYDC